MKKRIPCPACGGSGRIQNPAFLGSELRKLRETAGLPVKAVAEAMGISGAYLSQMELGARPWSEKHVEAFKTAIQSHFPALAV